MTTGSGFFYTANDHEESIARNQDIYDNATPSSKRGGRNGTVAAWQTLRAIVIFAS